MARFFICVILIFAGFMFCGWIAFGPFHPKVNFKDEFLAILSCIRSLALLFDKDPHSLLFLTLGANVVLFWYLVMLCYGIVKLT